VALAQSKPQPDDKVELVRRLGLSPRQQELNRRWAWYTAQNYDTCKVDWDGRENPDPTTHEQIVSEAMLPPGFLDAGSFFPLKFRRPTAPYRLPRVITNRFTGLLFSERHHPIPVVEGDEDTEDFVLGLIEDARLWPRMLVARTLGGGQGTVVVGFVFVEGVPRVEVHDARWCTPTWLDRWTFKLKSVEKRYQYPIEVRDPETGNWKEEPHWYRRVIDEKADTTWDAVPVGSGLEPEWDRLESTSIEHGFGFCPCVWIQNLPVEDDIDGESDCHGVYEMVAAMDQLNSQSHKGTIQNLDPTLLLVTKAKLAEIKKGSDNAIKLPEGGTGQYLEITGSGIKEARELVREWRGFVLEVVQCVLADETGDKGGSATAFEIARRFSSMIEKADMLREQYGENGVLRLIEMMVRAVRKLDGPRAVNGEIQRRSVTLSPRSVEKPDGSVELRPRKLGPGGRVKLRWPEYFEPTPVDTSNAVTAAAKALLGGIIDLDHAARYVAQHFRVKDVPAMLEKIKREVQQRAAELDRMAMEQSGGGGAPQQGQGFGP
jgi:hypothetical protein